MCIEFRLKRLTCPLTSYHLNCEFFAQIVLKIPEYASNLHSRSPLLPLELLKWVNQSFISMNFGGDEKFDLKCLILTMIFIHLDKIQKQQ